MITRCRKPASLAALALAGAVLASIGGCGVRGSLEPPASAANAATANTANADSGQGKPEGAAPKPHKDFILDGLLR